MKKKLGDYNEKDKTAGHGGLGLCLGFFQPSGRISRHDLYHSAAGTSTGHTYEAHPIFLGDLDPATNTLTNIRWAPGIWDSGKRRFGDAADKAASLSAKGDDSQEAREFAQEISKYLSGGGRKTVSGQNGTTTISGLAPGYYLIKEVNNTLYKKMRHTLALCYRWQEIRQ